MKHALTDSTTKRFFPCHILSETLCTEFFVDVLYLSISLEAFRDLTSNRSCMNEWVRLESEEGGHSGKWSEEGGALFGSEAGEGLCLTEGKEDSGEEGSEGTSGHRIRKETHYGESDCQAETGQSPSEHSEKREILENTPDCIWILQARGFKISTPLQPAGCLLPWLDFHLFVFTLFPAGEVSNIRYVTFTKKAEKESEMVNWRNCPGRISNISDIQRPL